MHGYLSRKQTPRRSADDDGEWIRQRLEELSPDLAFAIDDLQWTTGLAEDVGLMAKFHNLLFQLYVLGYQQHRSALWAHVQLVGMTVSGCLKMWGERGLLRKLLQGRQCLMLGDELEDWTEAELISTCSMTSAFLGIGDQGQILTQIWSNRFPPALENYRDELRSLEKTISAFEYLPEEVTAVLHETRRMGSLAAQGAQAAAPQKVPLVAHPSSPETCCAVLRFPEHHFTRFATSFSNGVYSVYLFLFFETVLFDCLNVLTFQCQVQ